MSTFSLDMTVEAARDKMDEILEAGGSVECPCCDQFAKIYKRPINSSMARGLVAMYMEFGLRFGYVQDVRRKNGETDNREESKLRFWGLVEEEARKRDDGGRAGYWRVTPKGKAWIERDILIPKYALIYNNDLIKLVGKDITIDQALGKKFRLDELMAATP